MREARGLECSCSRDINLSCHNGELPISSIDRRENDSASDSSGLVTRNTLPHMLGYGISVHKNTMIHRRRDCYWYHTRTVVVKPINTAMVPDCRMAHLFMQCLRPPRIVVSVLQLPTPAILYQVFDAKCCS